MSSHSSFNDKKNQLELVTATFNDKEKPNQFELVTATFNDKEKSQFF